MAYPNYPKPGEIRQGGESWFQIFLQKDNLTPITPAQLGSRPEQEKVSRQFTSFGFGVAGDYLESEAVQGSRDEVLGQSGERWSEGPMETEVYMTNMLSYIQGGLAADRTTESESIEDTRVIQKQENFGTFTRKATLDAAEQIKLDFSAETTGTAGTVTLRANDDTDLAIMKSVRIGDHIDFGTALYQVSGAPTEPANNTDRQLAIPCTKRSDTTPVANDATATLIFFTDVTNVTVTPTQAGYTRTVGKSGATPTPDIEVTKQPSDPAGATGMSIPKQLEVTLEAPSGINIPANYEFTIVGLRKTGLGAYDVELCELKVKQGSTAQQTLTQTIHADDYYFDQITAIVFDTGEVDDGSNNNQALTLKIIAKTQQKVTNFQKGAALFDTWSFLGSRGGQPILAHGVTPVEMTWTLSATPRLTMALRSGAGWLNRTLVGGFLEKRDNFKLTGSDQDTTHPDHPSGYPFIPNTFYPGYGRVMEIGDHAIIFNDGELVINKALDFLEGATGSPQRSSLAETDERETVRANITAYYENPDEAPYVDATNPTPPTFVDWNERFFSGQLTEVKLYCFYWNPKGKQYYHKITLPKCRVGEISQEAITGTGRLSQSVALRSIKDGTNRVVEWEVLDDAGWTNPTY